MDKSCYQDNKEKRGVFQVCHVHLKTTPFWGLDIFSIDY